MIDEPDIAVILDAIDVGAFKQTEIIEHCRAHHVGKRTTLRVLSAYSEGKYKRWATERGLDRNTIRYRRFTAAVEYPPGNGKTGKTEGVERPKTTLPKIKD